MLTAIYHCALEMPKTGDGICVLYPLTGPANPALSILSGKYAVDYMQNVRMDGQMRSIALY